MKREKEDGRKNKGKGRSNGEGEEGEIKAEKREYKKT